MSESSEIRINDLKAGDVVVCPEIFGSLKATSGYLNERLIHEFGNPDFIYSSKGGSSELEHSKFLALEVGSSTIHLVAINDQGFIEEKSPKVTIATFKTFAPELLPNPDTMVTRVAHKKGFPLSNNRAMILATNLMLQA